MSNIFDYCDNIRKIPLTALIFSSDNIDIDINVTTLRTHLDADIELGGPDGAGRGAGQRVDLGPGVGSLHVQAQVLEAVEAVAVVAADTRRARTGQQLAEGSLQVQGGDGGHGDQLSGYLDMVDSVDVSEAAPCSYWLL